MVKSDTSGRRPDSDLAQFMREIYADDVADTFPILKPSAAGKATGLYRLFEDKGPSPKSPLNAEFKKNILIYR